MKYIDLTHTVRNNMPVYPGDTSPEFRQTTTIEKNGCICFQVKTGMHAGTHMDAPLHMLSDGKKLSEFLPERFFGKGHLLDARGKEINSKLLKGKRIRKGDILVIMTGWSSNFGKDNYYKSYPEMTEDFARLLTELKVSIVAMDTPSPDYPPFHIHKILMEKEILIVESLTNLEELIPHKNFRIIALPAKFDAEAAPVRVIAEIKGLT